MAVVTRGPRARAGGIGRYAALGVATVLFLIPFSLLLRNAFMTTAEIVSPEWNWVPSSWSLTNMRELFADPTVPMARSVLNSVLVSVIQTAGVLVLSAMAGYGLARIPYRWSNAVFGLIAATLLIPASVTFVPSFVLVSTLGWVSSLQGLIVPGLFQALATFLFRQFYLELPQRDRGGRVPRRARLLGHVLAGRGAELAGLRVGDRHDHVHRGLERVPVAARYRAGFVRRGQFRSRCRRS
jgi:multiple sugar transport system permease protein